MVAQIEKLGQLVAELREQESAYLGLLLTLMDREGQRSLGSKVNRGVKGQSEGHRSLAFCTMVV